MLAFRVFGATSCAHSVLVFFKSVGVKRIYWRVRRCSEDDFLRMCMVLRKLLKAIDVGADVDLWRDLKIW